MVCYSVPVESAQDRKSTDHDTDSKLTKTLLSHYNGHITHLSFNFSHYVRAWIELDPEIGFGFFGNVATRTKLTVVNGHHVGIEDDGSDTVEKVKLLFRYAYSAEDYMKMDFEYGGPKLIPQLLPDGAKPVF